MLGAYFVLLPSARVLTLIFFFILREIPAMFFLGVWFAFQLWQGGSSSSHPEPGGGVAFFAHIGGFVFGVLTVHSSPSAGRCGPQYDDRSRSTSGAPSTSSHPTSRRRSGTSRSSSRTRTRRSPTSTASTRARRTCPAKVAIYRRPLEQDFPDPAELEHEIRITVLHELAHYFGFDEERLGELGYD